MDATFNTVPQITAVLLQEQRLCEVTSISPDIGKQRKTASIKISVKMQTQVEEICDCGTKI